jgi:hypothetical protein
VTQLAWRQVEASGADLFASAANAVEKVWRSGLDIASHAMWRLGCGEQPGIPLGAWGPFWDVAADPHGAGFILFKPNTDQAPAPAPMGAPGHVGWRELHAGDGPSAFDFYSGLFGWTKDEAMDMGTMGIYQTFKTAGEQGGGMMTKMPQSPRPFLALLL